MKRSRWVLAGLLLLSMTAMAKTSNFLQIEKVSLLDIKDSLALIEQSNKLARRDAWQDFKGVVEGFSVQCAFGPTAAQCVVRSQKAGYRGDDARAIIQTIGSFKSSDGNLHLRCGRAAVEGSDARVDFCNVSQPDAVLR